MIGDPSGVSTIRTWKIGINSEGVYRRHPLRSYRSWALRPSIVYADHEGFSKGVRCDLRKGIRMDKLEDYAKLELFIFKFPKV